MRADDDFCYDPDWLHPDLVTNVNSSFWIYVEGSRATNLLDLEYYDGPGADWLDEIWEVQKKPFFALGNSRLLSPKKFFLRAVRQRRAGLPGQDSLTDIQGKFSLASPCSGRI